jgi:hypothetical protein
MEKNKIPGNAGLQASGIGVLIQFTSPGLNFNIMVQASMPQTSSVLQAEASAMLLGLHIAGKLQIQTHSMN